MAARFSSTACCDIVVRSLEYCRAHKGLAIYAWVILDNHLHAILAAPDLSAVLRDLKSFTAKQLVEQIKVEGREWLLNQLRHYRAAHKANEYQLWQEGSHPQRILHDEMMEQSRAERDRLRAEPQPAGCRRRAASTAPIYTTTR